MSNIIEKAKNGLASHFIKAEISDERLNICKSCEEFEHTLSRCKKCGCFMIAKTKVARARCPIGKWQPI